MGDISEQGHQTVHVSQDTNVADLVNDVNYTFLYWMENWNAKDAEQSWHANTGACLEGWQSAVLIWLKVLA